MEQMIKRGKAIVVISAVNKISPSFLAPGTGFVEGSFSTDRGESLGMIQMPYTYCALYLWYYYISSISAHQVLEVRSWRLGTPVLNSPSSPSSGHTVRFCSLVLWLGETTQPVLANEL